MSTIPAGYFPAEIKVDARDLLEGDVLLNGDKVVEVRPVDALFPGAVLVVLEVEGMTNSMRVPGSSQYRAMRQFPVTADWKIVEEPVVLLAAA